jgi:membrane protease YdiL (CAAX protease family)
MTQRRRASSGGRRAGATGEQVVSLEERRAAAASGARATGNPFGLPEALVGFALGLVVALLAAAVAANAFARGGRPSTYAEDVASLVGLWVGLVGAPLVASRRRSPGPGAAERARPVGRLARDYGLRLRLWPDVPLGAVVGVASQYLLVPAVTFPEHLFVRHLAERLGQPARELTSHASGAGYVVLAVLVCVGSPLVEELFFRGLLLRGLLGRLARLGPRLGPALAIVVTGLLFGLAHVEGLQLPALAAFGIVLAYLAWRFGRLGPGIVAHMAFNAVTMIALSGALGRSALALR